MLKETNVAVQTVLSRSEYKAIKKMAKEEKISISKFIAKIIRKDLNLSN